MRVWPLLLASSIPCLQPPSLLIMTRDKGASKRGAAACVKAVSSVATIDAATATPPHAPAAVDLTPLVSLGPLIRGVLVKRPSASVKTPYVADVRLEPDADEQQDMVLAHAPSMDCAGQS